MPSTGSAIATRTISRGSPHADKLRDWSASAAWMLENWAMNTPHGSTTTEATATTIATTTCRHNPSARMAGTL